jgi:hypothetical protein
MAPAVVTSMEKVTVFVTMVLGAAENEVVREEAEALAAVLLDEAEAAVGVVREAVALAAVVGEEVDAAVVREVVVVREAAAEDAGLLEEAVAAMVREEAVVGDDAVPATAMDGNLCWT